ncbi:MAG: JDVT-CTERM system glutamic-type intramembrane protease [Granulosicoccaceae bacterium]
MNTSLPNKVFWKDSSYWLALLAGPVVWCLLYTAGNGVGAPPIPWEMFLKIAMLSPLLEEIVFRGGLQTLLLEGAFFTKRKFGISAANIVTSLVFAAAHLIYQTPMWACLVFFPSIIFGWARERYNSVIPSILLHAFYNAGFGLLFVQL